MTTSPSLPPELLEKLRRGVPLRLKRQGGFEFDGEAVTHERIDAALRAGLDVTVDGEVIVHLGPQWCYLQVDDTPLRVVAVDVQGSTLYARLDDGRRLELDPRCLWEEPGQGTCTRVPSQRSGRGLDARFTNTAQMQLSPHIEWRDAQAVLVLGEQRHPIPAEAPRRHATPLP